MTIILNCGVNVKTHNSGGLPSFKGIEVQIGKEIKMSMQDFCDTVFYVLTNTDLDGKDDPRLELKKDIENMKIVLGYNKGEKRLDLKRL